MAVTDNMNDLSSSHHRRIEAEAAQQNNLLVINRATTTKTLANDYANEGSHTSVESQSEEEQYLANDPYLAELLNSNHSRSSAYGVNNNFLSQTAKASSLSTNEASRTWNDLSSVHSKVDALDRNHDSSSSSFMDSASSINSFGGSEDGNYANNREESHDLSDDEDDDHALSLQKQAFQKLFDSPRKEKDSIGSSSSSSSMMTSSSNGNSTLLAPNLQGSSGSRRVMHRSASVRVRPTYHGPKLGLIEESSLH
jgi:hypothetical protein